MDKPKFNLSKVNIAFWSIIALFASLRFFAVSEKTSFQIGELVGQLTALLLIPMLFGWIAWRISRRSQRAGSITFNVVLALSVLGQLAEHGRSIQERQTLREIENDKEIFKKTLAESEDPEAFDSAYKEYTDSFQTGLNELATSSSGDQQAFYRIMGEIAQETQASSIAWQSAFNAIQSERILDFSRLNTKEEFKFQIDTLRTYIEATETHRRYLKTMLDRLKERLSVLGTNNQYARGAINGASEKYTAQKPILEPLFESHIQYGGKMIQLIQLLEQKQSEWTYQEGELLFDSDESLEQYNHIFEALLKEEAAINRLTNQLIEAL